MTKLANLSAAAGLAMFAAPAAAHHSAAIWNLQKTVSYAGAVKAYEWQNPHTWIWLLVPQKDGTVREVGIECASPVALRSVGLRWDSLKVGEQVTITAAPPHQGTAGGLLEGIYWPDGRKWQSPFIAQLLKGEAGTAK